MSFRTNDEVWLPITGYEGLYEVSNNGRVRNSRSGLILKSHPTNGGYLRVKLYKNSRPKSYQVHRLVALSFVGTPKDQSLQVNHIDGDKANNNADNLEWCTASENISHSFKIGIRDNNMKRLLETNSIPVLQLTLDGHIVKKWDSMSEAARQLNLYISNICHCCSGKIKSTGGFVWQKCSEH